MNRSKSIIATMSLVVIWNATTFGQQVGDRIVVVSEKARLKTLNQITGNVQRGRILTVKEVRSGWIWVIDTNGSRTIKGWIKRHDVVPLDKAIDWVNDELRQRPTGQLYIIRGAIWDDKGEFDNAIADYTEAIRLDPTDAAVYYRRGYARAFQSQYEKAVADYSESIRLDPKNGAAYYHRGYALGCEGGEVEREIADYTEAIRLDPENAPAFHSRGYARASKGEFELAIADYTESIRLDPLDAAVFFNRGNARLREGEFDKAVADYSESIRLDPRDRSAYYNRGHAWDCLGEHQKAFDDYSASTRLAGQRPLAAIVLEGNCVARTEDLLKVITARPGHAFDRKQITDDVSRLMATGKFLFVQPRSNPSKQGLVLVFRVFEMPVIEIATFIGNTAYDDKTLAEMTNLIAGRLYDVGANRESCRRVEHFYRRNGYPNAKVILEKGESWGERNVVVKIDEGVKGVVTNGATARSESVADATRTSRSKRNGGEEDDDNIVESFEVAGNGDTLLIPVTVAGQKYQFVLDTGCTVSVFDTSLRDSLVATDEMVPFNDGERVALYECRNATIGRSKIPMGQWAVCMDLRRFRELSGHDTRGILGMDVLRSWVVQIDFDAGRVNFLKNSETVPGKKVEIDYNACRCPTVTARVAEKSEMQFKIDTGFVGLADGVLNQPTFEALVRTGQIELLGTRGIETVSGSQVGRVGRIDSISIGEFKHSHQIFDEWGIGRNALGLGHLSRYKVTLDFPGRSLFLAEGKQFERRFSHNDFEPEFGVVNGDLVVLNANSDDSSCLLHTGDRILEVNGRDVRTMTIFSVRLVTSDLSNRVQMMIQSEGGKPRMVYPFPSLPPNRDE